MNWYKFLNRISLLLHALGSAVVYFLVEVISRHSFYETWNYMIEKPLVFAYNTAFIFTTSLIVYLFRRRCFLENCCGCVLDLPWRGQRGAADEPCHSFYRPGSYHAHGCYGNGQEIPAGMGRSGGLRGWLLFWLSFWHGCF